MKYWGSTLIRMLFTIVIFLASSAAATDSNSVPIRYSTCGFSPKTPDTPMLPITPSPLSPPVPRMPSTAPATQKHVAFFAIVQYDFFAERPDELDAKAGEAISVVAQSNREWFVAKPIGRLGGPGLIPVSFVELREPQSGRKMTEAEVNECMDRGTLPRVEVWKKATLEYKQSSIPLGVIDPSPPAAFPPINGYSKRDARSRSSGGRYEEDPHIDPATDEDLLPPGLPIQASIPSFHQESGEYWFRLDVRYQPDPQYEGPLPRQIAMVLYRNYDDFYAFQLDLLDGWPVEAGREKRDPNSPPLTEADRILPYMPGPVENVDEAVTVERRADLDIYVHELVALAGPPTSADYILRCDLVRRFFSQKPGDVILPPPSPAQEATGDPDRLQLDGPSMRGNGQRMSHTSAYSDHKSQRSMRSHGDDLQNTVRLTRTWRWIMLTKSHSSPLLEGFSIFIRRRRPVFAHSFWPVPWGDQSLPCSLVRRARTWRN